jgi:predicted GNAT family acetyltransferase
MYADSPEPVDERCDVRLVDRAEVVVRDNPGRHRFEVWVGGELAGVATYRLLEGSTYAFDHTEVGPPFEGRGLADALVTAALDEVRSRGGSVLPHCPYVRAWLGRHPAYVDLVPAAERDRFGLA